MRIKCFLLTWVLVGCLLLSACNRETIVPDNGIWYCEDLHLKLSFEPNYGSNLLIQEERIRCVVEHDRNSKYIIVLCQEMNASYDIGECIFSGEIIGLDDSEFVVSSSGTEFTFVRIALERYSDVNELGI